MSDSSSLMDVEPPHTEEDKLRIGDVEILYHEGKPLFDRETLKKISEKLAEYRAVEHKSVETPTLEIPDYVKDGSSYTISLDLGYHGNE